MIKFDYTTAHTRINWTNVTAQRYRFNYIHVFYTLAKKSLSNSKNESYYFTKYWLFIIGLSVHIYFYRVYIFKIRSYCLRSDCFATVPRTQTHIKLMSKQIISLIKRNGFRFSFARMYWYVFMRIHTLMSVCGRFMYSIHISFTFIPI